MAKLAPRSGDEPEASPGGVIAGALPLLALWSFAVTAPLFDLLAQNPTYLTAHALVGWPLLVFVFSLSLLLPLIPAMSLVWLSRRHWLGVLLTRMFALVLLVGLLNGLLRIALPELTPVVESGLSFLAGGALLAFLGRKAGVIHFLRLAALSALIFPATFLGQLPGEFLGFAGASPTASREEIGSGAASLESVLASRDSLPEVVLLVFDELALSTLLDNQLAIDPERYPNFSRLAAGATWFTQASAVAAGTRLAVPAILTGTVPAPESSPDAASHPRNLFSTLKARYALNVEEPITGLCNFAQCREPPNWRLVGSDTAVILGHLVAPKWVVTRLPPIGAHWLGFAAPQVTTGVDERIASIDRFLQRLESTPSPGFHFLHSLLPHIPYTILPSGERLFRHSSPSVSGVPGGGGHVIDAEGDRFIDEIWSTTEARHLYEWQLRYADRALGQIMDRLKATDKYDRSLLIVTADHGVRFVPGLSRREPDTTSFLDIASIPLLVKSPGQKIALRDFTAVQSTDIVTIVAQVLSGQNDPAIWSTSGAIAAAAGESQRAILSSSGRIPLPGAFDFSTRENLPLAVIADESRAMLEELLLTSELKPCKNAPRVELMQEPLYQHTHPEHFLAAQLLFRVEPLVAADTLIATFNRRIYTVHRTGPGQYSAFVDPELFKAGFNPVELVRLEHSGPDRACRLYELPTP